MDTFQNEVIFHLRNISYYKMACWKIWDVSYLEVWWCLSRYHWYRSFQMLIPSISHDEKSLDFRQPIHIDQKRSKIFGHRWLQPAHLLSKWFVASKSLKKRFHIHEASPNKIIGVSQSSHPRPSRLRRRPKSFETCSCDWLGSLRSSNFRAGLYSPT